MAKSLIFRILSIASFQLCFVSSIAQPQNYSLNKSVNSFYEVGLYSLDSSVHSSIRPILRSEYQPELPSFANENNLIATLSEQSVLRSKNGLLEVYPLINVSGSFSIYDNAKSESENSIYSYLSNGFGFNLNWHPKWFLNFNYMYASLNPNPSLRRRIASEKAVPAFGINRNSSSSFFNHYADGYLSYSPSKIFNFQSGMGRNFIGEGYRSMLLSDYAYNYPYFKVSTKVWKVKYVNLYAMQFDRKAGQKTISEYDKKYSSTHYLSINIGKRLNVGIFESVIWRGKDSTYNRGFDLNYINPVIFFRPVEFSVGSPDNVLLGLSMSYKLTSKVLVYSQLMLDEFLLKEVRAGNGWWANKYAYQAGMKIITDKSDYIIEYNQARPFTYSHSSVAQNYGHLNLPLAHPYGANFKEFVSIVRRRHNRFLHQFKANLAVVGQDDSQDGNIGQDIFLSNNNRSKEYNNYTLQGKRLEILILNLQSSYYLNWVNGLHFFAGVRYDSRGRFFNANGYSQVFAGIGTGIFNRYIDN